MPRLQASGAFAQALNDNADQINGALWKVYAAGTTTQATTYSNALLTIANAWPVIGDAAGRFPDIYVAPGNYRIRVETAGGVLVAESDNNVVYGLDPGEVAAAKFATVAQLLADLTTGYALGGSVSVVVTAGDLIDVGEFRYTVLASGVTDPDVTTAAGLKLRIMPTSRGYNALAFGMPNDASADASPFLTRMVAAVKRNVNWQRPANGLSRGGQRMYFPAGVYDFRNTSPVDMQNLTGLIIEGDGKEATCFVHSATSGEMILFGTLIYVTFQNIGFFAGTISSQDVGSGTQVVITDKTTPQTTLFDWPAASSARWVHWHDCGFYGAWVACWDIGGTTGHSECSVNNCEFKGRMTYVADVDNVNAVIWSWRDNAFENIEGAVFHIVAGGHFAITGGSIINPGDTLQLEPTGLGAGVGNQNAHFTFTGVKWEMNQNNDPTSSPQLVNCINPAAAMIVMNGCSNDGGSATDAKVAMTLKGTTHLHATDCRFYGEIDTTPTAPYVPLLQFDNCTRLGPITRNADASNGRYALVVNNSPSALLSSGIASKVDLTLGRTLTSFAGPAPMITCYYNATIGAAGTTQFTRPLPENMTPFGYVLVKVQVGTPAGITVRGFTDAARSAKAFDVVTAATTTAKLYPGAMNYTGGISAVPFESDGTMYFDIITDGAAGFVILSVAFLCAPLV